MDDVRVWQQRPLEDVYPVVLLNCLVLKIPAAGFSAATATWRWA
jgi:transposase-like protein